MWADLDVVDQAVNICGNSELRSDAVVNCNSIAANTDAHLGNLSHLTHNATNPTGQCSAPQYPAGCRKKIWHHRTSKG